MPSPETDRLALLYAAYRDASTAMPTDLSQAQTRAEVNAILKTVDELKAAYYRAVEVELGVTGPAIESAYAAAVQAQSAIRSAREGGAAVAERIRLGTALVQAVKAFLKAAKP